MKRLLALALLAGLIICSAVTASAVQVGQPAPDFEGKTIDGKDFKLSDYKGQIVLLKIGTTWCPSCRLQTKAVDSLHDFMAENGVRFIDVFVDESEKSVRKYFKKGEFHLPTEIIMDEGAAHKAYNVYVIPRLVLIDKEFKVVRDGDTISAKNLKKKIEKILN